VGKTGGVVAFFSLLTLSVVCKIWFKGTSTKMLKEQGSIIFSFNFPFPLEVIFHLPPSTCVLAKLARISLKEGSIFSHKGISRVGVMSFEHLKYQPHWRKMGSRPILE
jgi:hypothetical protein